MDIIKRCGNCKWKFNEDICYKWVSDSGMCEKWEKRKRNSDIEMKEKLEKCKKLEEVTNGQFNFKDIY